MDDFVERLARRLAELGEQCVPAGYVVALSGGLDSSVLLAACHRLSLDAPLRACYVNHHLHPDSDHWARHCAELAGRLGVAFVAIDIQVSTSPGQSPEAAARAARYRALGDMLRSQEMLLTAHHQDDQLETLLLRLLRGTGVRGLRGILPFSTLGRGFLARPLLTFSKAELMRVAEAWKLDWIEDSSNADPRFDRNYLRNVVLPAIKARWPGVARPVGRTAEQMRDAQSMLESISVSDAAAIDDFARIPLDVLRPLDAVRQKNLLRFAISELGLPLPTANQLKELIAVVAHYRHDSQALVRWNGVEARLHGDRLYLLAALATGSPVDSVGGLAPGRPWLGPEGQVELIAAPAEADRAALAEATVVDGLDLRFRAGGEALKPAFDRHHRKLKKLFQDAGIVPWMRSRIPLLYRNDVLVAVADLWISDSARARTANERAWRVRWTGHPPLY